MLKSQGKKINGITFNYSRKEFVDFLNLYELIRLSNLLNAPFERTGHFLCSNIEYLPLHPAQIVQ